MTNKKKTAVANVNGASTEGDAGFNISDYMLSSDVETRILTIPETGDEFEVQLKPMSWSKRNKLVSKCLSWDDSGTVEFDGDIYVRGCLKEMIVNAPWGPTTEAFLLGIDTRLGAVLEGIVPKAFEDTLAQVETVKKAQ